MRNRLRYIFYALAAAAVTVTWKLLETGIVLAHDCSSEGDCLQTAGYNAVTSIGGGIIAILAAILGAHFAGLGGTETLGTETSPETGPSKDGAQAPTEPVIKDSDGSPLINWDSKYGAGENGYTGKPGDVWYGGNWISPEQARSEIAEDIKWQQQRELEIAQRIKDDKEWIHQQTVDMARRDQLEANRERAEHQAQDDAFRTLQQIENIADKHGYDDISERAESNAYNPDGSVNIDYVNKLRDALGNRIGRDSTAPDEQNQPGWFQEGLENTFNDARHSTLIRIGSGILSGGTSEVLFQSSAAWDAMERSYNQAEREGRADKWGYGDALLAGGQQLVEENLPVNIIKTCMDPNATTTDILLATAMDMFTTMDTADTFQNLRGSFNTIRNGGGVMNALTHRAPPLDFFPGKEPEVPGGSLDGTGGARGLDEAGGTKGFDQGGGGRTELETGGTRGLDEAGGGPRSLDDAGGGTKHLDEAGGGTKQLDEAGGGPRQIDEAGGGTKQLDEAGGGPRQIDEAGGGTKQLDEAGGARAEEGGARAEEGGGHKADEGGARAEEGGGHKADEGGARAEEGGGHKADEGGARAEEGGGHKADEGGARAEEGGGHKADEGGARAEEGGGHKADEGGARAEEGGGHKADEGGGTKGTDEAVPPPKMDDLPPGTPVKPSQAGIPDANARGIQQTADEFDVDIEMRQTNPDATVKLEQGYPPKDCHIKNKTGTELDELLGAPPGHRGEAMHFPPELPPGKKFSDLTPEMQSRFNQRFEEYAVQGPKVQELQSKGLIEVKDGVIYNTGLNPDPNMMNKPFAGDHDIFKITPRDGSKLTPELEQAVANRLSQNGNGGHGSHLSDGWNPKNPLEVDARAGIGNKHLPVNEGGGGEALIKFSPGGQPTTSFASGADVSKLPTAPGLRTLERFDEGSGSWIKE